MLTCLVWKILVPRMFPVSPSPFPMYIAYSPELGSNYSWLTNFPFAAKQVDIDKLIEIINTTKHLTVAAVLVLL